MSGKPKPNSLGLALAMLLITPMLTGCHVQWVSPYSTDLQKKATDMLQDVVAWESHMRNTAGTAAADPRHPDVQAKLEAWRGDIEVMSAIELGMDPGSAVCDKFLAVISSTISDKLKKALPTAPAATSSGAKSTLHCETLPDIFTHMMLQVSDSTDTPPQPARIPLVLNEQCKLQWLSDDYFASLTEGRATAGASSPARPAPASLKTPAPTEDEQTKATTNCRALFEPPYGSVHGNLVSALIVMLESIIYREGRQAPLASQ
jgi:hypothetical protein